MTKFKRCLSAFLALTMVLGMFSGISNVFVPQVSAAAGTTNVTDYATLDAQYDKFIYVGVDVIELANGELTDGYVQPGDWLEYRATILSDMYVGSSNPHIVYERDFFDVRVITSTTPSTSSTFEKADYEGNVKFADGTFMNPDHPVAPQNGDIASYNTLTALPYSNVTTQLGFCGIDAATYENWDLVKSNLGITATVTNTLVEMKTDEWITSWNVRVKEGLADGDTGRSFSPAEIWKNNINTQTGALGDSRRLGDVYTADVNGTYASGKSLAQRMSVVKHVLLDDCEHTFTIGEAPVAPPSGGEGGEGDEPTVPEVTKYEVKFLNLNGTEIATEKTEYAEGEAIVAPEVENLLGWVDSTGKLVEVATTMGTKALTYTAVLKTDKFDVKVALSGGTYAADAALPEGATVEGDNLIIKAALGETVDFTAIPLPEKEGHTASWSSETVKVESIKGATVTVKWTINSYIATFYLDKEAYEAGAEALTTVTFVYDRAVAFGKAESGLAALRPEKKFVGWKNAATGETVEKTEKFKESVTFYADWTDYDSTVTVWGRDYTNGGWKVITTKYADIGATIKINDLRALVKEENYGTAAAQYVVAGSANVFSEETAIRADFATVEGNKDVYLFTKTNFSVTFKTPAFDENGYITEEFTEETKAVASLTDDTFLTANIVAGTPAEHAGYTFVCWTDAEGNEYAPGAIALNHANGTAYEFTAKYELVEYSIEFAVNNTSAIKEIIKVEGTFTVGDAFNLSEMTLTNEAGEEATLPEIDKENKEQAGGPYRNVDGYKFAGWKVGIQAANYVDYDVTQEVVLTPAVISSVALGSKITIKGFWEALYYDFVAHYAKTIDEEGNPVYEAMPAIKVATGESLDQAYAAALETVNANLPEGKRFSLWKLEDGSERPTNMPAYGTEVYATYLGKSLSIYVDYNYGTEDAPVALDVTMSKSNQFGKFLTHGMDVVNDIPAGEVLSIDKMIRTSTVGEAVSPGDNYEVVGWNVYYVVDENDVYNPEKWNEGISDVAGSTIAKYTLIYQVDWMAHKDFLFRVYNTDGALRSAIDKKFQKYFWYMDKPTDEEGAMPLNTLPDRLIILGFMPKLDGFDFNRFFEADMWSNLSIRVDPLTLSKAWLNPANWGSLLEALWNAITSGFGGELW